MRWFFHQNLHYLRSQKFGKEIESTSPQIASLTQNSKQNTEAFLWKHHDMPTSPSIGNWSRPCAPFRNRIDFPPPANLHWKSIRPVISFSFFLSASYVELAIKPHWNWKFSSTLGQCCGSTPIKNSRFITAFTPFFTIHLHSIWHPTVITRSAPVNFHTMSQSVGTFRGLTCAACFSIAISCLLIHHVNLSLSHAAKIIGRRTRRRDCFPLKAARSLNAKHPAGRLEAGSMSDCWANMIHKREVKSFLINVRLTLSPLCRKTHKMPSMTVSA